MVTHFTVNLNKASNRLDIYEQKQKKRIIVMFSILGVVVLALIGTTLYFSNVTAAKINYKKNTIAQLEEQIAALEASESFISREDVYGLIELSNRRVEWATKFLWLAQALPKDIAITELNFNSNILVIKGISKIKKRQKDLDRVMSIIDRLTSTSELKAEFANMKFKLSNRIKHQDREILSFEIACPIQ